MHNLNGTVRDETQSAALVIEQKEADVGRAEPVRGVGTTPGGYDLSYWAKPEDWADLRPSSATRSLRSVPATATPSVAL